MSDVKCMEVALRTEEEVRKDFPHTKLVPADYFMTACTAPAYWRVTVYTVEKLDVIGLEVTLVQVEALYYCAKHLLDNVDKLNGDPDTFLVTVAPVGDQPLDGPGVYVREVARPHIFAQVPE